MAIAWQGGTHGYRPILCAVVQIDFGTHPSRTTVSTFYDLQLVANMIALCYHVGDDGATDDDQLFVRGHVTEGALRVSASSVLPITGIRLIGVHVLLK